MKSTKDLQKDLQKNPRNIYKKSTKKIYQKISDLQAHIAPLGGAI